MGLQICQSQTARVREWYRALDSKQLQFLALRHSNDVCTAPALLRVAVMTNLGEAVSALPKATAGRC